MSIMTGKKTESPALSGRMTQVLLLILLCVGFTATAVAQGTSVRLEGQVVCCEDCWAQADRTKVEYGTAEDLLRAKGCVEGGDPTLIAVRDGDNFKLYQLEKGKFRLEGKNWYAFVGKHVAVTGAVRKKGDSTLIRVDALEVLAESIAEQEAAQVVGREVDLTLKDLSGVEQRLSALKGRIVVLNFWATYCVPCKKEMPDLAAIQNEYAVVGVQVIGASTDEVSDRATVVKFVKETKVNFPIWIGATTADMVRFGLGAALPGTVIIGRDGRISKVVSGVVNQLELKKQIEAMLTSAEANPPATRKEEQVSSARQKPGEASSVPS